MTSTSIPLTTPPAPAPGTEHADRAPSAGFGTGGEAETVLVAHTIDDVPVELPPGLVVVLPGGFRMRSLDSPAPPPDPRVPLAEVAPPQVVPPDAARTRARAAELTRLVIEVLAGRRPPAQLGELTTPRVLRYLTAMRTGTAARPALARAGHGGRAGAPGCGGPVGGRAGRVHVGLPHADAAEVCVTVPVAGRPRALVLRLDRAAGDAPWVVTAARLL
ncbi:hypothetical protein SAMN05216207_1008105 [Pseudonocardia ammonioxydans]|uniref:Uncharacterized protein n=1 Tax=Pseudonocardia ammonioxydans TaxID=260086 RepID=A0A1I4WF67_PSUAM|nr:Rv3235 family protein [Pseudonocardia ammonioxydans]SFN12474.1 hypothetical protein SAMN05216207_1008105 [Pseudonocardia ammonioxydans]